MKSTFRNDITATKVHILMCEDDFDRWYLSRNDYSCFTKEEIKALLEDEKPSIYPCIPLQQEDDNIIYVGLDLIRHWFDALQEKI
jgi:hypothetical protein